MPPPVTTTTPRPQDARGLGEEAPQGSPLEAVRSALEARGAAEVTGVSGAARGRLARALLELEDRRARTLLAVTETEEEADLLAKDLAFFLAALAAPGVPPVLRVPADPVLPYDDLSPDRGLEMDRLAALCRLHLSGPAVRAVVVSARALARRMVPRKVFERHADLLGKGVTVEREALAARLAEMGYARVPLVEDPGTFAVRGGILDLWSPVRGAPGAPRVLRRRGRELPRLRARLPADLDLGG